MIEKNFNGTKVSFHDSIKELPNIRKFLAESYLLWQEAVGTELDKVRNNIVQAIGYISRNKLNEAVSLLQNADLGIEAIKWKEDFALKELSCYIYSVGEIIYPINLTNPQIDQIAEKLNEIGIVDVDGVMEEIKKKS